MAKITKATFKSFIKRNYLQCSLLIRCESKFDGQTDSTEQIEGAQFSPAREAYRQDGDALSYNCGIGGVWLVGSSAGNSFTHYETETHIGIHVYNCCGSFTVAIAK